MGTINGQKDLKKSTPKKKVTKSHPKKKAPAKKKAPKKKAAADPEESKPADANACAAPGPGKASKSAQGTTSKSEPGKPGKHTTEFVPTYCVEDGFLTANVNVSMGARIGLENYSDARCSASLTIPVLAKPDLIDEAYEFAKEWVETRVQAMIAEIQDENE